MSSIDDSSQSSSPPLSPLSQISGDSELMSDPFGSSNSSASPHSPVRSLSPWGESDYSEPEADFYISILDEKGVAYGTSVVGSEPIVSLKEMYALQKNNKRGSLDTQLYVAGHKYPGNKDVKKQEYPLDNAITISDLFNQLGLSKENDLYLDAKTVPFTGPYKVVVRSFWGWAGVSGLIEKYGPPFLEFWTRKALNVEEIMRKINDSEEYPFRDKGRSMQLYTGDFFSENSIGMSGPPLKKTDNLNNIPAFAVFWGPKAEKAMFPTGRIDPTVKKNPRAGRVDLIVALDDYPNRFCATRNGDRSYDWDGEMPDLAPAAGGHPRQKSRKSNPKRRAQNRSKKTFRK